MIRANIATKKITFKSSDTLPPTWDIQYKDGVLTVTVNMGFPDFLTNYNDERKTSCQPISFCTGPVTPAAEAVDATRRSSTIRIKT